MVKQDQARHLQLLQLLSMLLLICSKSPQMVHNSSWASSKFMVVKLVICSMERRSYKYKKMVNQKFKSLASLNDQLEALKKWTTSLISATAKEPHIVLQQTTLHQDLMQLPRSKWKAVMGKLLESFFLSTWLDQREQQTPRVIIDRDEWKVLRSTRVSWL